MTSEKKRRLDKAVVAIRREWGQDALRQVTDSEKSSGVPHIPTGFPMLDRALRIGGVPKGHLTQFTGIPTSGAMTLAYKILAQATGEALVYVDLAQTFDADYAARCGVDTANLLLIQPKALDSALETLTPLLNTAAAAVLALDVHEGKQRIDTAVLNRLMAALRRSRCALLVVERAETALFSTKAAIHLHLKRECWLYQRQDVNGYRVQVRIIRNQFGQSGQSVRLVVGFSAIVRGDGT
ncbi:MAG: P-loop NTPase family protein [Aggregatilineales bacterium]